MDLRRVEQLEQVQRGYKSAKNDSFSLSLFDEKQLNPLLQPRGFKGVQSDVRMCLTYLT